MPVIAFLKDHKAATLDRVVEVAKTFATAHNSKDRQFLLAADNSGIDAATNIVVKHANQTILFYVYAAVSLPCFKIGRASCRDRVCTYVLLQVDALSVKKKINRTQK